MLNYKTKFPQKRENILELCVVTLKWYQNATEFSHLHVAEKNFLLWLMLLTHEIA